MKKEKKLLTKIKAIVSRGIANGTEYSSFYYNKRSKEKEVWEEDEWWSWLKNLDLFNIYLLLDGNNVANMISNIRNG